MPRPERFSGVGSVHLHFVISSDTLKQNKVKFAFFPLFSENHYLQHMHKSWGLKPLPEYCQPYAPEIFKVSKIL